MFTKKNRVSESVYHCLGCSKTIQNKFYALLRAILLIFIASVYSFSFAQNFKGIVVDTDNKGIAAALIVLTDNNHQTIFSSNTDSLGNFEIQLPQNTENNILFITCFGYKSKEITDISERSISKIVLETWTIDLDGVDIKASRPTITRQADKFVVPNIYESPIAKGRNIVDFLKYTPLVEAADDGSVAILGKGQATIYLNGRESEIDLKNIPAENIERVEIISNPGSRYPAATRNGIINIVLRKQPDDGTSLTLYAEDRQNRKNSPSGNVTWDVKKGKFNFTTGIRASSNNFFVEEKSVYNYFSDSLRTNVELEKDFSNNRLSSFVNFDYNLSKKHVLGFRIEGNLRNNKTENKTKTAYRQMDSQIVDSSDMTFAKSKIPQPNYRLYGNLNYNLNFNDRQKLTVDFDYRKALSNIETKYDYSKEGGIGSLPNNFMTRPAANAIGYAVKTSFLNQLDDEKSLAVGIQLNSAAIDNKYFYGKYSGNNYVSDSLQSNQFLYNDFTTAAYVDYNWIISDFWELKAGLRTELYSYEGLQKVTNEKIKDQYTNLFPALSIYFTPENDDHELGFDFSSNIFRPGYAMLNPFKTFYSPTLYQENNPYLKPSIDYEFELSYIFRSDYMFIIDYAYSKNSFTEFTTPVGNRITKMTTLNYDHHHDIYFIVSLNHSFFNSRLDVSANADLSYSKVGGIPDEIVAANTEGLNFRTTANIFVALNKKKDFKLLTRFQYSPPSTSVAHTLGTMYYWEVSLSKSFQNSTLSVGINDITDKPLKISLNSPQYSYSTTRKCFDRTFWATYSIRFGNTKVKKVGDRGEQELNRRMTE